MPHIPCYQSGVIVNCAPVSVASENRSLSMWVGHFLKASSVVEESCSQRRTKLFRNQLKQRNCPEISHQKNCRGHNIKRTLHRRDQNQSPSNISSKCGRISSLRRAKRSLPNTKLSNFEVQHSIIQLGNVFCPKLLYHVSLLIFLQIGSASEVRWLPKHKSSPNFGPVLAGRNTLCVDVQTNETRYPRKRCTGEQYIDNKVKWEVSRLPMSVGTFVAIQGSWEN